ncbi:glycosyltransferase family A protein [Pseudomonas oleovorans]|uniref:Glycosyltransferase family 2 protein n=1 Tax=Ectopseudomonas oleovorans TaxID=301 RepID=A0AA42Q9L2_ECTOL|nr:glycosyltransferase family A protein [Pseudomonas oleovorans]MDH1339710.1 glycosyltransferase family 2 protein [Pseudomonas oleovorans]MDH1491871.1 glycosyltransferase family 2 protein [Pseudomonas oleovorans]MDH2200647.1 glycosyltransferase family 2 protein [Pseudomonas oleovorans]WGG21585.1 glycosyltransferase family 2 protein [Pseudomonas oleovorans]
MTSTSDSSQPLVSVIIASYNHAPYIEASIESVLQQSYPNIELLVVDDGSRDDSVARIEALQKVHGFDFRVQANKGLSRTLNETIERARGSLIAPFGSDDIMLPQRIATQVAYMADKPEVGICAGAIQTIDADGRPGAKPRALPFRRLDFEDVFMNRKPGAPAPTLMFRREALEAVGGFDPDIRLEDVYIELMITRHGYRIDVMEDVLACYRVHANNTYKQHRFMVDAMLATLERFADHPRYVDARGAYLNSMLLKTAKQDVELSRWILRQLPFSAWRLKTLRGLLRLFFSSHGKL